VLVHHPEGPEDVAAVVAFLASADAAYVAGVRIAVDAGGTPPAIVSTSHT
jgi:NAD(P)-dependent dehydrogenase (short-subunit alcohol dehydrogenase family)